MFQVFITKNNHHCKLAFIDRNVLWEGSLNILSQTNSREIMRRIEGENHAPKMFNYHNLGRIIKKSKILSVMIEREFNISWDIFVIYSTNRFSGLKEMTKPSSVY